jgi:hypothetical protein
MRKSVSCCLIVLVLAMSGLAFPLPDGTVSASDDMSQVPLHADDSWTLNLTENRYLFSPRLRSNGNEALRSSETLYLSFGKKEQIDAFRMRAFSAGQSVIYKQALQTYENIKPNLASHFFLAHRKCMDRLWVKPSSLSTAIREQTSIF